MLASDERSDLRAVDGRAALAFDVRALGDREHRPSVTRPWLSMRRRAATALVLPVREHAGVGRRGNLAVTARGRMGDCVLAAHDVLPERIGVVVRIFVAGEHRLHHQNEDGR